jgi:hypothetical protein
MNPQVACVVEGHGDREAAPIIMRRIAAQLDPPMTVHMPHPIRIPKTKLLKAGELERAVELAARQIAGYGAILILIDGDDDCPAQLGPALLQRAMAARKDVPLAVVVAKREFEGWFLAAAESLRGFRGLATNLTSPPQAEAIRGAKEWLTAHMESNRCYVETLDQPALAGRFDLEAARRADSFDKFYREVVRILTYLRGL